MLRTQFRGILHLAAFFPNALIHQGRACTAFLGILLQCETVLTVQKVVKTSLYSI